MKKLFFSILCCLLLAGCGSTDAMSSSAEQNGGMTTDSVKFDAMTTTMSITVTSENTAEILEDARSEILRLDELFSIGSKSGDIAMLNANGTAEVSEETAALLSRACELGAETGGLFDCTIGPVMDAWGFPAKDYRLPSDEELSHLLPLVDSGAVNISGTTVTIPEGVTVDLGGIAKGYASQHLSEMLAAEGVNSALIYLGGNVQTLGTKPDGTLWKIAVQDPEDESSAIALIQSHDEALITSGAYERCFEKDGVLYHHIIDPRTGYPADSGLISVTIVSPDGTLADTLSTALYIMGEDEAVKFWRGHREEFEFLAVRNDGSILLSSGLTDRCTVADGLSFEVIQ